MELPGVKDKERVRNYLQSTANLQFWEVYNIGEIAKNIEDADKSLQNYLNGVEPDTIKHVTDTSKAAKDTSKSVLAKNDKPLVSTIHFIGGFHVYNIFAAFTVSHSSCRVLCGAPVTGLCRSFLGQLSLGAYQQSICFKAWRQSDQ